ncbi:MAG: hypothetical protein IKN70_09725 [Fibrobacter sp.]|nr:hypothetical protein [Fibrobacter sp.]
MVKHLVSGLLLAFVLLSCGDDGSSSNPAEPISEKESSSSVIAEPESSSDKGTSSIKESSSSIGKSSSSSKDNKLAETSSSGKAKSSSSLALSSSSLKGSSSSAEVSSSSGEEKESSSSSVKTSSSSQKSSSSSAKSSSSKPKSSSSSAKSSSSSAKSSSSTVVIPSKLYDCEEYKCVTTKYLNPEIEYGEYLDVRDTQVYRTVQIGEQVWMAQNLNYKSDTLSFCYRNDSLNCLQWGRLYTWEKALTVCPDGWRLPDTSDYFDLLKYVDENNGDLELGESLESLETGYYDIFGFSILFGSGYAPGGVTFNKGGKTNGDAYFWTSSEAKNFSPEEYAIMRGLWYSDGIFGILDWRKEDGLAVRCLKD